MSQALQVAGSMPEEQALSWNRLPGEPSKAFRAFTLYRDLGLKRTLLDAQRLYSAECGREFHGASPSGYFAKWCAAWRWVERTRGWDNYCDQQELNAARRARIRRGIRQAERAAEVSDAIVEAPLRALRERNETNLSTELAALPAEDLVRLARHVFALLPDLASAEQRALTAAIGDTSVAPTVSLKAQGEVLRRVMSDAGLLDALERTAFEVSVSGPVDLLEASES